MLRPGAAVRSGSCLAAALACLALATACGSGTRVASESSDTKQPGALTGVSCFTAADCTAVGSYDDTATGPEQALAEHWNGTAWHAAPPPGAGWAGTLDSVSCPSATRCTAVGSLIAGWNGAAWTIERRSSPFVSVSCPAPGSCVAVGVTAGGAPESGYWDGSTWRLRPLPLPPHPAQSVTLAGVSCSGPRFCVAVGDYSYGVGARPGSGGRDRTFAERWNGSFWQVMHTVNAASWNRLSAVSCTSPRACTAVGSYAQQFPLAERWNGSAWRSERVPALNKIGYTELTAVSCSTDSSCLAAGTYDGGSRAIGESWNAGTWRLSVLPGPPQAAPFVQPAGVSCAGPAACVAVGTDGAGLAEVWNDGRWRITPVPGL
jgi:hypothetical protein